MRLRMTRHPCPVQTACRAEHWGILARLLGLHVETDFGRAVPEAKRGNRNLVALWFFYLFPNSRLPSAAGHQ